MTRHSQSASETLPLQPLRKQPVCPALRHVIGVSLSGTMIGVTVAFSASANQDLEKDEYLAPPTTIQIQWMSSLVTLTCLLSAVVFGTIIGRIGKKQMLMAAAVFYCLGYCLMAYSRSYSLLFVGRGITGVGMGATSLSLSPYISEISPTRHRGKFASLMAVQVQFGIIFIGVIAVLDVPFRVNAAIMAGLSVVLLVVAALAPMSPRWLVQRSRFREAEASLRKLMGGDEELVAGELRNQIEDGLTGSKSTGTQIPFWSKQNIKPMVLLGVVMIFRQLTACNALNADSNRIFENIGLGGNPRVMTMTVAISALLFLIPSSILTDKAGRKTLLVVAGFFLSVSLGLLCIGGFLSVPYKSPVLLVGLAGYVMSLGAGWVTIPWVLVGELFAVENQGPAVSVVSGINWTFNFLTVFSWAFLSTHLTPSVVFGGYGGCMFLGSIFVLVFLPETKGLTLHQITELFR